MNKDFEDDVVVSIKKGHLISLLHQAIELRMLDAGGVDNWDWHYVSLYDNGLDLEEEQIRITEEVRTGSFDIEKF